MIAANMHAFLQHLSLVDECLKLQLLDWQEGEMDLVPIYALISHELENNDFYRLTYQYNRTLRPPLTKIVTMTVPL
jgi:hypothetical protein